MRNCTKMVDVPLPYRSSWAAVFISLLVFAACTHAKNESSRAAQGSGGASADSAHSSTAQPGASPQAGADMTQNRPDSGGVTPGGWLIDYSNAKVNCAYQNTKAANAYNVQCVAVVKTTQGQELAASGLAPGVTLTWSQPESLRGTLSFTSCAPTSSELGYNCLVTVTSSAQLAEAQFGFQVKDPANLAKSETTTLVLPYSVSLAAGFIPNLPYQYTSQTADAASVSGPTTATPVGHQQLTFAPDFNSFFQPTGICLRDSRLFFSDYYSVYALQNGQVSLYAGSTNFSNRTWTGGSKLNIFLTPSSLACSADAVYASSYSQNTIFKIKDDGTVTVVAGNDSPGEGADGSVASQAAITSTNSLALDNLGNVYFSELRKVRMVTSAGMLQTVAGTGVYGYSGDGGPAKSATLKSPRGLAVGPDGSIYIADQDAAVVRKVDTHGVITTVAGTGTQRYNTSPLDPRALAEPVAVAFDHKGNLYVAELARGIKQIMPDGSLIQVVSAGSDLMQGAGALILSSMNNMIRGPLGPVLDPIALRPEFIRLEVDQTTGVFYTNSWHGVVSFTPNAQAASAGGVSPQVNVAGSIDGYGTDCAAAQDATKIHLLEASSLAFAADSSLLVADWLNRTTNQVLIHRISQNGPNFQARALYGCQSPPSLSAFNPNFYALQTPSSLGGLVAAPDGSAYLAMSTQNEIVKLLPTGEVSTFAGNGAAQSTPDGQAAAGAPVNDPFGLALGSDGSLYFSELTVAGNASSSIVRRINPKGILSTVAGSGVAGDSGEGLPATQARLAVNAIAVATDGRIFLADAVNAKIKMIDTQGLIHTIAGSLIPGSISLADVNEAADATQVSLGYVTAMAVTNNGTLYLADTGRAQILELKPSGSGWSISVLFGTKSTAECSTLTQQGSAAAGAVNGTLKNSLSTICRGDVTGLALKDTCPAAGGETRIAFSQHLFPFANIVEIVKPCGT